MASSIPAGHQDVIIAHETAESASNSGPTISELHGDNHYAQVARKHWLKNTKPPKVKQKVLKEEIWNKLEEEGFSFGSLLVLENLQFLEKYLWPGFSESSSYQHVLLIALMINVKRRENLDAWSYFAEQPADFSSFFRRVLAMTVDVSLSSKIRTHLISFIIGAFQSIDSGIVRKEVAPLVAIAVWSNLHSDNAREVQFSHYPTLKKAWNASNKRYEAGDDEVKAKLRFDRSWLFTLLLDFLNKLYDASQLVDGDHILYCERFVEFLTDLQSQLQTRRYVNTVILDLQILPIIKLSPLYAEEESGLFRDLVQLLEHYTELPIVDHTGQQLTAMEHHQAHCAKLAKLQRIAIKHFNAQLAIMSLANYGSLDRRVDLEAHLDVLSLEELGQLCGLLGIRTEFPDSATFVPDRPFYIELLVYHHEKRPTFRDTIRDMAILPTERILYEETFLRNENYNGSKPLAIPKLNLQYLTVSDFLWRSFALYRSESFYGIRKDMEDVVKRVQPKISGGIVRFNGFSRMALPIGKPAIIEVTPPRVGESFPAKVRAEVILDTSRLTPAIRREWESLRPDDIVFLLAVHPEDSSMGTTNGQKPRSEGEQMGLKRLRAAEVVQLQDEEGRPLREDRIARANGSQYRAKKRRIILKLDAATYQQDKDKVAKGRPDIYDSINLVVRRRGRENNFKPILESIKHLALSDIPTPKWFQDVFLGYSDPAAASYKNMPNRLKDIDFRDTFLNWQHLIESLPGKSVEPSDNTQPNFAPPYVLGFSAGEAPAAPVRPSKKRRRDQVEAPQIQTEAVQVSTYKPPNMGPYPTDAPKLNSVRFTAAQVEAIRSGTQPGLTVIIGPPGTGKTDVATQIINNIYHNFPQQRTLLIARSNQALNQLFQKIVALDIDERHLLRLGHGEEELETDISYSKHGRVESFLEMGTKYLAEVTRLSSSIGAPGAHGNSCETADYFNSVYIKPTWTKYWDSMQSSSPTLEQVISNFPFASYFSDAPGPIFPIDATKEQALEIAAGCYRHIEKVFLELEDIRPFEILRHARDRANYLLVKEARIIAMTSTHAAMRRQEIADLGFRYDNVIMEEAAQMTEIEAFTPLALQNPKDGKMALQRIVLCGDHYQNSPIVQNLAFRQYANLEQSLFQRLVRLGVPTIMLDKQGRARPSLAELYKWRYSKLENLPVVESSAEFRNANSGFRYDYQFINVPDYKGKGEMEPTPHFIQNLGEAEYAVAIFMYMRLLGYPAAKISILTTYAGQRALVRDVLQHRCSKNPLFGMPRIVTTVDKYQGEQNDYIILSLTRTNRVGYLRDIRRLTVALSRSRLGLYILGRREVFESCFELKQAFDQLLSRPDQLALVTGEMYPTSRAASAEPDFTTMEGVEHLGQYVYEMTQAKVAALKAGGGSLPAVEKPARNLDIDEDDEDMITEEQLLQQDVDGIDDDEENMM